MPESPTHSDPVEAEVTARAAGGKAKEPAGSEPESMPHCWETAELIEDGCGRTCMLPADHGGEHDFQRDDEIVLEFTDTHDTFTMAEAKLWFAKWKDNRER